MRHKECDNGCQYAKDVGMWPAHTCYAECIYWRAQREAQLTPDESSLKATIPDLETKR